jgi:pilus assembly protein CpaB
MQLKQLIALAYAVSAGALAIGLTATYMRSVQEEARTFYGSQVRKADVEPVEMSTVVALARSLPYGHELRRADFKEISWPAGAVPAGAFRRIGDFFAAHDRPIVRFELAEGEIMLPTKVSPKDGSSALSLLLPKGKRAVTIKVNEVRGVGGFIQPQDRVDVLMTEKASTTDKTPERRTSVLLQDVLVLAIGQSVSSKDYKPTVANSVTVAVDLRDAQKLALAMTVGHLSLALRNPLQPGGAAQREVSLNDLRPGPKHAAPAARTIRVYRSAKASDYSLAGQTK